MFQSTRPARGATRVDAGFERECSVSIHAPREGRDRHGQHCTHELFVSIHAPREGRDIEAFVGLVGGGSFNPRAPRGARPLPLVV